MITRRKSRACKGPSFSFLLFFLRAATTDGNSSHQAHPSRVFSREGQRVKEKKRKEQEEKNTFPATSTAWNGNDRLQRRLVLVLLASRREGQQEGQNEKQSVTISTLFHNMAQRREVIAWSARLVIPASRRRGRRGLRAQAAGLRGRLAAGPLAAPIGARLDH